MPRPLRVKVPNILFHVINRGNGRQKIFSTDKSYDEYIGILRKYKDDCLVKIYHYALMPNHVHLLLEAGKEGAISRFMQRVTLSHTRRFNLKNKSSGHVWQGRFKSILIETDGYYLQCARYIELNPMRAHLAKHPKDWRWSSYHHLAHGADDELLDEHPLYSAMGSSSEARRKMYAKFVESQVAASWAGNSQRFSGNRIYGSEAFIAEISRKHEISIPRLRPGRPRGQV